MNKSQQKRKDMQDQKRRDTKRENFEREFVVHMRGMISYVHEVMEEKGFHENDRPLSESIALMHSELSEALEADREGNPESEKIDEFYEVEEELADLMIRVMDAAGERDLRIGDAIAAKMAYNTNRPYKHGKQY